MFKPQTKILFQKPTADTRLLLSATVVESCEDSAEHRQTHRAIALSVNLFAAPGEDRDLTVQDVSPTGFAVVSKVEYSIGATLDVSLTFDGDIYSGTALVQSIREFSSGRIRYGLCVLEQGDLQDGLQQISLAVQRQQLKRQSGLG